MRLTDHDQRGRLDLLDEVFRPSAPVDRADLFSGRAAQLTAVTQATRAVGQHAVIFGERGVGKTSLAATCAEIARQQGQLPIRITADQGDNFHSLWQKVIDEFPILVADAAYDRRKDLDQATERATEVLQFGDVGPNQVRVALRHLTPLGPVVVFIDEFDQIKDPGALTLIPNTIKLLSDKIEKVTLVPIGIADSVSDLIAGHVSIQRNLVQVAMRRMNGAELEDIFNKGLAKLKMTATDQARGLVRTLPRGFPQYAHMLAQEGARQALMVRSESEITHYDIFQGLTVGLEKLDHSLQTAFNEATYTAGPSRFADVLYACAIVVPDTDGFFSPADLRTPYSKLIGQKADISRYNKQLGQLSQGRGKILHRKGPERARRYRFADPLMEPYVLLRGIKTGKITMDMFGDVTEQPAPP